MAKPNATAPGLGTVAIITNNPRPGRINTFSSETSGASGYGRSSHRVRFVVV